LCESELRYLKKFFPKLHFVICSKGKLSKIEFCFVCDQRVRARGFRRLEDLDNLPPQFQEIALVRRRNNNLDERNIENGEVIHTNCYRHIIREIEANENDNGDDHCRFNCVLQRRNMCFVCGNNRNLNILSLDARIDIYLKKEIFVPKAAVCCWDHFNDTGMLRPELIETLRANMRDVIMTPKDI
jgi:hypothetical protein